MESKTSSRRLTLERLFSDGWIQYALCLVYIPVFALDWAGLGVPAFSGFMLFVGLLCALVLQVAYIAWRRKRKPWRSVPPRLRSC